MNGLTLGENNISCNWGSKLVFSVIKLIANGYLKKPFLACGPFKIRQ